MLRRMGLKALHIVSSGTIMRIASLPLSDGGSPSSLGDLLLRHFFVVGEEMLLYY